LLGAAIVHTHSVSPNCAARYIQYSDYVLKNPFYELEMYAAV